MLGRSKGSEGFASGPLSLAVRWRKKKCWRLEGQVATTTDNEDSFNDCQISSSR
jgi:hypothetical protein